MLSFKSGKGTSVQALAGNTTCLRSIEVVPLLFNHEQWQQCLQSSTNDTLCSHSTALIVVQSLHIFQEHTIAASFLFLLHWLFFSRHLYCEHHSDQAVSDAALIKTRADIETLTEQNSHYRCLFDVLPVKNGRGDKRVLDSSVSLPVETTHDSTSWQWWCCMFLCVTKITWLLKSFYQSTNNHNNVGRFTWCCEDCRKNWTSYKERNDWRFCQGF